MARPTYAELKVIAQKEGVLLTLSRDRYTNSGRRACFQASGSGSLLRGDARVGGSMFPQVTASSWNLRDVLQAARAAAAAKGGTPHRVPSWAKLGDDDGNASMTVLRPKVRVEVRDRHRKFCEWLDTNGIERGEVKPIAHLDEGRARDDVRKGLIQAAEKQHFNAAVQPLQLDAEPPHPVYYQFAKALGVTIDVYADAAKEVV